MSTSHAAAELWVIAERYRAAVEAADREALAELYHPDALLDAHVPNWRFQVQGRHAIAENTGALPGRGRFTSFIAEPTASGDLLVRFAWRQEDREGGAEVHEMHLWRLVDGRIFEQVLRRHLGQAAAGNNGRASAAGPRMSAGAHQGHVFELPPGC